MTFFRATAAKYYEQSGNNHRLFQCYAFTEDYSSLEKLSQSLQDNDPLLKSIGDAFTNVGLIEPAVDAYRRVKKQKKNKSIVFVRFSDESHSRSGENLYRNESMGHGNRIGSTIQLKRCEKFINSNCSLVTRSK